MWASSVEVGSFYSVVNIELYVKNGKIWPWSEKKSAQNLLVTKKMYTFAPAKTKNAPVAQLVEHLTLNQGVQGSSPCGCTNITKQQDALSRERKRVLLYYVLM